MDFKHVSVLLDETIEQLHIKPDGIYVDGTLGGGGHAYEVCKRLGEGGRLIGIDQDREAIEASSRRLAEFGDKVTIVRNNYSNMVYELERLGIKAVDGILLDLGVSSHQLDDPKRGFSYMDDSAPLDMRMDDRNSMTAADLLNTYDEESIYRIIRDNGEERYARNIAAEVIKAREIKPLATAGDLKDVIDKGIPLKVRRNMSGHPARKTFQALRIEINHELDVLSDSLDSMIDMLSDGGRIAIITFHSLEDRIVKNKFKENEDPCTCPPSFPVCVCGAVSKGRVITRRPIIPSDDEMETNSRSTSSKLRVFERKISSK